MKWDVREPNAERHFAEEPMVSDEKKPVCISRFRTPPDVSNFISYESEK